MTARIRQLSRRGMLKLGLAGAGIGGLARFGLVAAAEPARARRVLIINLTGGIRSSAAFHAAPDNAAGSLEQNPWGTIKGPAANALSLGQLLDDHLRTDGPAGAGVAPDGVATAPLDDSAYTTDPAGGWKGQVLPRFRESNGFSVVGTWDEERADHTRASIVEPTGSSDGSQPGILTRVLAGLSASDGGAVPCFHVAPFARFGNAEGPLVRYAPVTLASTSSLPGASSLDDAQLSAIGHDWAADEAMRDRLDQRRLAGRVGHARQLVEGFTAHRRTNRDIGARLAEPWVHVENGAADAAFGEVALSGGKAPLTNAMLLELAKLAAPENPYGTSYSEDALNWMLGVRLLQLGSPAVTVETSGFDFHSGEVQEAPALYATLGRLWATLGWLLARIPEADGKGTMLDNTLVMTMSDFGRDRGTSGGFNGGDGSDHGIDPCCFFLAHAVMGAGVPANRLFGAAPTDSFDGRGAGSYTPRQLLATMLLALGLDHAAPVWGFDDVGQTIPLWS